MRFSLSPVSRTRGVGVGPGRAGLAGALAGGACKPRPIVSKAGRGLHPSTQPCSVRLSLRRSSGCPAYASTKPLARHIRTAITTGRRLVVSRWVQRWRAPSTPPLYPCPRVPSPAPRGLAPSLLPPPHTSSSPHVSPRPHLRRSRTSPACRAGRWRRRWLLRTPARSRGALHGRDLTCQVKHGGATGNTRLPPKAHSFTSNPNSPLPPVHHDAAQ